MTVSRGHTENGKGNDAYKHFSIAMVFKKVFYCNRTNKSCQLQKVHKSCQMENE